MKAEIESFAKALAGNEKAKAESILTTAFRTEPENCVKLLRKSGVFRTSRYQFESNLVLYFAKNIQDSHSPSLSEGSRDYIDSVIALSTLAPFVAKKFRKFKESMNARSFKTYLIAVELLFRKQETLSRWDPNTFGAGQRKEEIAEAFSFYYSLLMERTPPSLLDINTLIESKAGSEFYLDKLQELSTIIRFREAEIQIESFPYVASTVGQETIIRSRDPVLEKSVRWGYIRAEMQREADRVQCEKTPMQSIRELAKIFVNAGNNHFVEFVQGPFSRVRLRLPLVNEFVKTFSQEATFKEDYSLIVETMKTFFIDFKTIQTRPIFKSVTLLDLIKFRRFNMFLFFAIEEYFIGQNLVKSTSYFRSLILHFSEAEFLEMIQEICGIPYAAELLEVLLMQEHSQRVLDIQYTPVLKVAGQYLLPVAIAANSDTVRNALFSTQFRFDADGTIDSLGEALVKTFAKVGAKAVPRTEYTWGKADGEIDVMVRIKNYLFIFECKQSLIPCNVFELRQSYNHIRKGFVQLSRLRDFLADAAFREYLTRKSGISMDGLAKIVTCVVTSNRMFDGYREDGHCVRCVHELANIIVGGEAKISYPKDFKSPDGPRFELQMRTWKGTDLSAEDLIEYLDNDSFLRPLHETMVEHDQVVIFGRKSLRFRSYYWDATAFFEKLMGEQGIDFNAAANQVEESK